MALTGLKNAPFAVQIKMDEFIFDDHKIHFKLSSAPGISIVSPLVDGRGELTFTNLNYDTNQNLMIVGSQIGTFTIKAESESPYFSDKEGQLKQTVTEFQVQIKPFIGWEPLGSVIGPNVFPLLVARLVIQSADAAAGYGQSFKVKTALGGNGVTIALIKPDLSVVATDTDLYGEYTFTANQVGTWYAYALTRGAASPVTSDFTQDIVLTNFDDTPTVTIVGKPTVLITASIPAQHITGGSPDTDTVVVYSTIRDVLISGLAQTVSSGFTPSGFAGSLSGYYYNDGGFLATDSLTWVIVGISTADASFTLANYYKYRIMANPDDPLLHYGASYTSGNLQLTITFNVP
jgi:hypothetical protein